MTKRETEKRTHVPPRFDEAVKRLTLDMKEAERYLIFAELPETTVEGLSAAVDQLRSTVWAVLNSVVDQFSSGQRAAVLLTSHRIQRAQALLSAVGDEIDAGHVTRTTPGAEDLQKMFGVIYKKLTYLMGAKPATS